VDERIARLEEQIIALRGLIDEREKQGAIVSDAAQKAITTALDAQRAVNATQNEFRGTLSDQARLLMPRLEAEQAFRTMAEKIDVLTARVNAREDRGAGLHQGWLVLIGAVALIGTIIGSIVALT
jgi:hypothetical protein